ncbi:ATP-binding cassette domain-containing protein, partial [Mesorhizobium sp.]|uniref:ATP-binding cassette domain-containing protein n=1 Tax=Mesorhizobium sp. TaxID=1871066 RepID=UPI0025F2EDC1
MLTVSGISKKFGGTQALEDVSFSLNRNEILALLGENGAGKSTLIKILAGVYSLDRGTIHYDGADYSKTVRQMPIAFIHQDLGLIDWMTVEENVCLTLSYPRRLLMIDAKAMRKQAEKALAAIDAGIDPGMRVQSLSRTDKSLVAIARALATKAKILVLDEPTASLPADEVMRLFTALRRLRAGGVSMIYVSHRLDEIFEIGDRTVVLRDGRVAGERIVSEASPADIINLIVGREPSQIFKRPPQRSGTPKLVLDSVRIDEVGPVDCEVQSGEIVALVGLRGAGQEVVGRALFGLRPVSGGNITIDGVKTTVSSPRDA